jgi:hypothetical protein
MKTAGQRAALGFSVRTGKAFVVAVGGPAAAPAVLAKGRIDVASTFEEGAVFHAAQELPAREARALVERGEARFTERARTALAAFEAGLDAEVIAAGMAAAAEKKLPPLESILRSHPLVHAAEGELYRRVFAAASAALGAPAARVPADGLPRRIAAAASLTPAKVTAHLAEMGKASGKPWAADQKQAALAAWLALVTATGAGAAR